MGVSILSIAILAMKVSATYAVSIAVTSGLQYYHDFKLTKSTSTRKGRGRHDNSDYEGTISRLKSNLSESD